MNDVFASLLREVQTQEVIDLTRAAALSCLQATIAEYIDVNSYHIALRSLSTEYSRMKMEWMAVDCQVMSAQHSLKMMSLPQSDFDFYLAEIHADLFDALFSSINLLDEVRISKCLSVSHMLPTPNPDSPIALLQEIAKKVVVGCWGDFDRTWRQRVLRASKVDIPRNESMYLRVMQLLPLLAARSIACV